MRVNWSESAKVSFAEIIDFIQRTWGDEIVIDFLSLYDTVIDQIKENPYMFKSSTLRKEIRKGLIHKNVSFFYEIKNSREIDLLFFVDNRADSVQL